jgi:hypothetical protein
MLLRGFKQTLTKLNGFFKTCAAATPIFLPYV